ncbi:MAG: methionyl-tRNA formyltransferase, partial [Actinomycetota bacterium]|nr:methionyl-tRNA formyltransferase [Actinomycetota bacterium]
MTPPLRIVFAGTPDFARTSLAALLGSRHEVIAVYTQPDRPAGRGQKLAMSPVKEAALAASIPVFQPQTLKTAEAQAELAALQPDLMVVVAYGLLLPKAVLDIPRLGCVNVHGSILPRWRGAAPVQRAIAAGDSESGVTIMQMDVGLDTGDMLHIVRTPIAADDTGGSLHDRLAVLGAQALVTVLDDFPRFLAARQKQDDALANYAHKLKKDEGAIDWTRSAHDIVDLVRAFDPWPVAQTTHRGEIMRIWCAVRDDAARGGAPGTITGIARDGIRVACGANDSAGGVRITRIQLPGKKAMPVADLLNGHPDALRVGEV